jgi:hypothetical protein
MGLRRDLKLPSKTIPRKSTGNIWPSQVSWLSDVCAEQTASVTRVKGLLRRNNLGEGGEDIPSQQQS